MGWSWLSHESISRFWSKVARSGRYDQEPQTWEWKADLEVAIDLLEEKQPKQIISYGCADGCRDPAQLLKAANGKGVKVTSVVAVDCTDAFARSVRERVEGLGVSDFRFVLNKPEQEKEVRHVA